VILRLGSSLEQWSKCEECKRSNEAKYTVNTLSLLPHPTYILYKLSQYKDQWIALFFINDQESEYKCSKHYYFRHIAWPLNSLPICMFVIEDPPPLLHFSPTNHWRSSNHDFKQHVENLLYHGEEWRSTKVYAPGGLGGWRDFSCFSSSSLLSSVLFSVVRMNSPA
jgi:hypothetical protein